MSIKYCFECGGALSAAARRCPHCGGPGVPRRYLLRTWLGAAAVLFLGGVVGYFFGPGPVGKVARAREAMGDAALPVTSALDERAQAEVVRAELRRYVLIQERFFRANGRYQNYGEAPTDAPLVAMNYLDDPQGESWIAAMHSKDHPRIYCAVAVGKTPAYLEGIVLKRSGQVRCSRDLSTRINRFVRQILPVRFAL